MVVVVEVRSMAESRKGRRNFEGLRDRRSIRVVFASAEFMFVRIADLENLVVAHSDSVRLVL